MQPLQPPVPPPPLVQLHATGTADPGGEETSRTTAATLPPLGGGAKGGAQRVQKGSISSGAPAARSTDSIDTTLYNNMQAQEGDYGVTSLHSTLESDTKGQPPLSSTDGKPSDSSEIKVKDDMVNSESNEDNKGTTECVTDSTVPDNLAAETYAGNLVFLTESSLSATTATTGVPGVPGIAVAAQPVDFPCDGAGGGDAAAADAGRSTRTVSGRKANISGKPESPPSKRKYKGEERAKDDKTQLDGEHLVY